MANQPFFNPFFLVVLILLAMQSNCYADKTLYFGGVSNIPPFSSDEGGIAKGFLIDVFRQIAERAGFQAHIQLYPFNRLNKYLEKGLIDGAISIFHKQARESYLVYSESPVLVSKTLVFVKKGNEFKYHSIGDLFGKRIGMMAGWSVKNTDFDAAITQGKIKIAGESNSYQQNITQLITGRVDCIISTELLTWYHARNMGAAEEIVALERKIDENLTYIAISKKSPHINDIQSFMERLNTAHLKFISDGTYEMVFKKYSLTKNQ